MGITNKVYLDGHGPGSLPTSLEQWNDGGSQVWAWTTWRLDSIMSGMWLNVHALASECAQLEAYVRR